jgi:SAM-dependent methyltransferase
MVLYDQIGHGYSRTRRADARIVERIAALLALPAASHIADVGAGTGNYSNALAEAGYKVVAIEPSATMRSQAVAHPSVIWREGFAEALPLRDGEVNAAICIVTFHHISDHRQALREMGRATAGGPALLLTFEPRTVRDFWLDDYFPEISRGDETLFPPIEEVAVPRPVSSRIIAATPAAARPPAVRCTATGGGALIQNNAAGKNTATGADALFDNQSGPGNTATGLQALTSNTAGANNTAHRSRHPAVQQHRFLQQRGRI